MFATSLDTGINAEIYYSIVGGNEYEKFVIDPISGENLLRMNGCDLRNIVMIFIVPFAGVISLAQSLDYEKVKDYLLTVQATDRGMPPLSNHATVNVTVVDANDNVPTFTLNQYMARISEDVPIGDIVLKVWF